MTFASGPQVPSQEMPAGPRPARELQAPADATPVAESATPAHVACIMDGNGRWAQQRRLERTGGHSAGEAAIVAAVQGAHDMGIKWLTLFAFSTENWRRPQAEVDYLMRFNQRVIRNNAPRWHSMGLRLRYLGALDAPVPDFVREDITRVQDLTAANTGMTLTMAFNHGGRRDLVNAFRSMIDAGVQAADVNEELLARHMQQPDLPDVDLLIRTSGEHRLSNFLLWQMAYAEMYFPPVLWPDFRAEHLAQAIATYHSRQRRYGAVTAEFLVQQHAGAAVAQH
ncbi:polyprenyl diphosphate synthase [Streptomyces sp. NPDC058646]|uniref:polyprenyl diphosphate synthase n=1 Tax=Streptomyces sp. NPDC058646 TaxID=3346574 RepID=UPI0036629FEC